MHTITALACGVRGAENGHAYVYRRGTVTPVQWWSDFEGLVSQAAGTEIGLDANGRAVVYVNELVDVVVKDSSDVQVMDFVDAPASGAIEVRSTSFTGTHYETAEEAVNLPLTLTDLLNLWVTKTGGTDWDVVIGGVTYTIIAALGQVLGMVHNVKASPYNAQGDGTTDDSTAINAANTAANVTNGIVVFPPGNYRVDSQLTKSPGVHWIGAGEHAVTITSHYTLGPAIVNSGSEDSDALMGMQLTHGTYVAQPLLLVGDGKLYGVWFNGDNTDAVLCSAATITLERCRFELSYDNDGATVANGSHVNCSYFVVSAASFTSSLLVGGARVTGNTFHASTPTSGTRNCVELGSGQRLHLEDNYFVVDSDTTAIALGILGTSDRVCERGTGISGAPAAVYSYGTTDNRYDYSNFDLGSRRGKSTYRQHTSGTSIALAQDDVNGYEVVYLQVDDASLTDVSLPDVGIPGMPLTLVIENADSGSATFDVGDPTFTGGAITLGAGEYIVLRLRRIFEDNADDWEWMAEGRVQA